MSTSAPAPNADALRVELQFRRMRAQIANRATGVLDLRGEFEIGCEAIIDRDHEVTALEEFGNCQRARSAAFIARAPTAAMNINDRRAQFLGRAFGMINIQFQV